MVCFKVLKSLFLLLFGCLPLFSLADACPIDGNYGKREHQYLPIDPNTHWYESTVTYRWIRPDEDCRQVTPPDPLHYKEIRRAFDFWSRHVNWNYTECSQNQIPNFDIGYGNWNCSNVGEFGELNSATVYLDKEDIKGKDVNYIHQRLIHGVGHFLRLSHNNDTDSLMHRDLDNIENKTLLHTDYQRLQMLHGHHRPRRDDLDVCSTTHIDAVVPFEDNATLLVFVDRHWYLLNGTKQKFGLRSSFPKLSNRIDYVDAVLAVDNSLWIFSGDDVNKVNIANYSPGQQSNERVYRIILGRFSLPDEMRRHVQTAFSIPSANGSTEHYILVDGFSYELTDDRKVDHSSKKPIEEKWVNMPHHLNVAFSYNGELYFIGSETKYTPTGELNEYGNPKYSMVEVMTLYTTTEHNGIYTLTESEENPNEFLFKLTGTDFAQNCNLKF